jgi:hypothetical protein
VKSGVSLYIEIVRVRRISLAVGIAVLGALAFAPGAQACSCARMGAAEAMRQADAAIVGRLVKVVPRGELRADFRYRVRRVYKEGPGIAPGRVISVRSAMDSAACGLPRQAGRRYGLLLVRDEGRWIGGLCGVRRPGALASTAYARPSCAS